MRGLRALFLRLGGLFRKDRRDRELAAELESHLEMHIEDNMRAGMSLKEARRQALLKLGGVESAKERYRDRRGIPVLESLWQDLRFAVRILRKNPAFTAVAILTIALGVGANTAIFTVVHAVLLNPLPYPNADRLAIIWSGLGNETRAGASGYELMQIRERSRVFDQVAGIWVINSTVPGDGEPEQVKLGMVTSNFLSLLCARPAQGRLFRDEDSQDNSTTALIISYGLWQRRFGGDPNVVGRTLHAGDYSNTIVGVLPQDFRLIFPDGSSVPPNVDLFIPLQGHYAEPGGPAFLHTIGRLLPGANFAQAQSDAEAIAAQLRHLSPEFDASNLSLHVVPLHDDDVRTVRRTLVLLFGGVVFVLLIACANVANLLLARTGSRVREMTLRAALGASRSRTIRQLLTESTVLGLAGGAAALAIGWGALQALLVLRPQSLLRLGAIRMDGTALLYTLSISVVSGIIFGLVPALAASRVDINAALKSGSRGITRATQLSRTVLVTAEIALSFTLLIGTGLLVRTFLGVLRVDPGFRPENVLTFTTSPGGYDFAHRLQQGLLTIPGVQFASAVSHLPLDDSYPNWYDSFYPEGAPLEQQSSNMADCRSILPGYFRTIGGTFLEGRDVNDFDDAAHQHVAIIDEELARQTWPGQDALGKKLNVSDSPKGPYQFERDWLVVVGVVKHVQYHSLTVMVRPQIYVPFRLAPRPISFVMRASVPLDTLTPEIREQVSKLNGRAPVARVMPLTGLVDQARAQSRFVALLTVALAGVALLLACIGVAGVTSYSIAQRTSEIGIRMTLGASPEEILHMILRQNIGPVIGGLVAGLALSLALTPLLANLLFGVRPGDPLTFASISLFLLLIAVLACYLPARRVTRIEPSIALRYE
jgi:predicted permease